MTNDDDLAKWSASWLSAPSIDIEQLVRKTESKRKRMKLILAVEFLGSGIALTQLVILLLSGISTPLRIGIWVLLPSIIGLQILFVYMRRGLWSAQGSDVVGLLELSERQTRFGMNYSLVNGLAFFAVILFLIPIALQELQTNAHDTTRLRAVHQMIVANGTVLLVGLGVNIWYLSKQAKRLRSIRQMLLAVR